MNQSTQTAQTIKPLISIIIPFYNEAMNVEPLYHRLKQVLDTLNYEWELICINDGSRDDTLVNLVYLHEKDARVQVIDFSRNFGKEAAMSAGIDYSNGDVVIPLDADLQDPPELLPQLLEKWESGYDIVNAVRQEREGEGWLKRFTAYSFYRIINKISNINIPRDTGDFRLLSRPVIEALRQIPERRRFMKGLFAWVGFKVGVVYYHREPRFSGKTSWNYWKLWNFALEGITSFSQIPLQLASYIGLFVSLLSLFYGFFFLLKTLIYGNPVAGYPSLIISMFFLGGMQLMALGIIGEYLGRIYEETKNRPIYIIRTRWLGTK